MDEIGLGGLQLLPFTARILIPSFNLHALPLTAGGTFKTFGSFPLYICTYIHNHACIRFYCSEHPMNVSYV